MPFSSSRSRPGLLCAVAVCLQLSAAPLQAQADPGRLTDRLDSWYHRAQRSAPGQWGIAVADQSGTMLWSVQPDQPLMPASTVKLFTTGFARSVLGGSARRPTRVVGVGSLDPASGEWIGSWAIEMNGDPSLERAEGSGPTLYDLALQLAGGGVRKLTGPLQVQSSNGAANALYPGSGPAGTRAGSSLPWSARSRCTRTSSGPPSSRGPAQDGAPS